MGTTPNLVVAPNTPQTPLFDPVTGQMSFVWIKWFQGITQAVNAGLNIIGQFTGIIASTAQVQGRTEDIGATLHNISAGGVISTDNLTDGTGSPLAGGKEAFSALVASGPLAGRSLIYTGTAWMPENVNYGNVSGTPALPATTPAITSKWLDAYDATTGFFSQTQPAFSDLTGAATAAQVPALSALTGQITAAQLPPAGISGTVTLAKLTTGGTNGSLTFVNGQITAVVNPT